MFIEHLPKRARNKGKNVLHTFHNDSMANSLYETCLQGILGVVFNKTYQRLGNAEYNYLDSLPSHLIGGIEHSVLGNQIDQRSPRYMTFDVTTGQTYLYGQLSLNKHFYKTDTSDQTPGVGPVPAVFQSF